MTSADKVLLCRVVGVLILSDGQLTDEEYDFFYDLMDRLNLTEAERTTVRSSIQIDSDFRKDVEQLLAPTAKPTDSSQSFASPPPPTAKSPPAKTIL
jgi:DNA replication initiation complex subunit (GINS family)